MRSLVRVVVKFVTYLCTYLHTYLGSYLPTYMYVGRGLARSDAAPSPKLTLVESCRDPRRATLKEETSDKKTSTISSLMNMNVVESGFPGYTGYIGTFAVTLAA